MRDGEQQWREFADFATLEKLLEVGQSLIVVRDLGTLLQKIAESAGAVLGADVIVLYEYHEEAGDVTVPPVIWGDIWHPEVPMGRGRVRPHRESAVFKMLERTEPFYASDAREDWVQLIEEWSREEGSAGNFVYREGIVSSAAVPLTADAERVGVLFVNYRTHHTFPDKEQKTIELFATQAAIAIQNARFLADLQRQVKGHRALNAVGAKLAGMLDEETILNCVARSAADTLDCTHCSVFRIEAGELVVVAAEGNRAGSLQPGRTFKLGQGVAGWVAQNGQSALVRNTLEDKRFEPGWSKPKGDPQSLVVVPIFLGGKVYGVISAEQDRVGAFDEQDQRLIETLALQASQAVQNARLVQQEQTLRRQAETLREISTAITSDLELQRVAERILDELGTVLEYRKASMQLIRDDTRTLIAYRSFKGKKFDEWLLRPISQDRLISRIVESKKPLILSDPSEDDDWEIRPETADVKSWLGLPLVYRGEAIGLLTLDHDQPGFYTQALEGLLVSFANQAAIAIENARLFGDAERRIRDLGIVNEVVQVMSTKLDIQDLSQTIVSQIADELNCTHCTLFLLQEEDGEPLLVPRVTNGERSEQIMKRRFKPGEGLAGWVFKEGKSLVLDDARKSPDFAPATDPQERPRSMLVAPVRVGDRTIGVISADQDEYGWFSESDRRLLDALARQAGIAIERTTALELLQDIGNQIISAQELDDTLRSIVAGAIELTNTTSGTIYLISEDGKSVTDSFLYPPDFDHPPPRLDREEGITRQVIETGEIQVFPDIEQDDRINPALHDLGIRSMIAIPLKLEEQVIGVLYLNDSDLHDFTETEVSLLSTLASQAASAIENARLFQELDERATQFARLQEVTTTISAEPPDIGRVSHLIVDSLGDIFPGASCAIRLYDSKTDTFRPHTATGILEDLVERPPRPGGTSRYVIRTRVPRYLEGDDLTKPSDGGPTSREIILEKGVKAAAYLPLLSETDVIGILYVNLTTPYRFSQSDKQILELFADQAAIAIENTRLFEKTTKQINELLALQDVGKEIISELDLDSTLQLIAEKVHELTGSDRSLVLLVDEHTGSVTAKGWEYPEEHLKGFTLQEVRDGVSGWVLENKEPALIPDVQKDPRCIGLAEKKAEQFKSKSLVIAPLLIRDRDDPSCEKVIGTLTAVNAKEAPMFAQDDLDAVMRLADLATIAVENARLFEQLRKEREERIEAIREIGFGITAGLDPEEVLNDLLQRTLHLLKEASVGEIWLLDEEAGKLRVQATQGDAVAEVWELSIGEGIVGWVAESRKPYLVGNVEEDLHFVRRLSGTQSELAVPMFKGTQLIGVLNVEHPQPNAFVREDVPLLEAIASQVVIALDNARLYDRLDALAKVGQAATSTLELDEVLDRILQESLEALGANYGTLRLLDRSTGELMLRAHRGEVGDRTHESIQLGQGITGWVAQHGEPFLVGDVLGEPRYLEYLAGTRCELAVPIKVEDRTIGVLNVEHPQPYAFDKHDMHLLEAIASQAAMTVRNARLYEARQIVNEVGQALTSGIRLREGEILELIRDQASKLMDTDNMYIALYDEVTDTVRFGLAFVDGRRIDVTTEEGWQPRKAGKGSTEHIIRSREPLFFVTKAEAEEWYAQPGRERRFTGPIWPSWLGVPMMVGEKVLGVIATYHPTQDHVYSGDDLAILEAMANQAAIALDNAHMFYDVNQRLEALVEFERAVTSGLRLREDQVLELIYNQASKLMDTDNMYIALYDELTDTVRFGLAFVDGRRIDVTTEEGWQPRKEGKGRTEEIIRTKEPIFIATKAEAEAWYLEPGRKDYLTGAMFPSWLGVPMMVSEKVLGVIATYHPTQDHVYSGDDLAILQAMANQAAIALDNAHMFYDVNQRLEALVEFGQAITSDLRLREDEEDEDEGR